MKKFEMLQVYVRIFKFFIFFFYLNFDKIFKSFSQTIECVYVNSFCSFALFNVLLYIYDITLVY